MDDTLGFSEQDKKGSEEWQLGETEESIPSVPSRLGHNQDLLVSGQKKQFLDRPTIDASKWEKLAFYRSYATSPTKTQYLCMQQEDFKTYLWAYLTNVFLKTLPSTYVYTFFSAYSPDSHFFISRILPIAHGSSFVFIITAFVELLMVTLNTTTFLDYTIVALLFRSPWNRCTSSVNFTYGNASLKCLEAQEFAEQFVNKSVNYSYIVYVSSTSEFFQLPQLLHYHLRNAMIAKCNNFSCIYFVILWIGAACLRRTFFKRYIWRTLHSVQMALNFILFVTFIHLTIIYFEKGFRKYPLYGEHVLEVMQEADIDLLSESMVAPPLIHILSSRSTLENKPVRDSALIVTSNAIYYTFRGLVAYLLKLYCDNLMNTSVQDSYFSSRSLFYLWPIYFSQFYLGDLFGIFFFLFNFINEYLVIVISLQCLIEAIVSEWRWLRPWMVSLTISVTGVVLYYFNSLVWFETLYILFTSVSTLMEVIIIFYIYPLGRLVDDMTFYNGLSPTKLRVITFWIVPAYYALKFYLMMCGFFKIAKQTNLAREYPNYEKFIYILLIPMTTGALYAIFKYVIVLKMGWMQLFKPLPNWGPKDFRARQLRKRYDSRYYIRSQAPRELSRYLIEKSELHAYKLDVRYDVSLRLSPPNVEYEDEKKTI